jgi:hypothetical protein
MQGSYNFCKGVNWSKQARRTENMANAGIAPMV